MSIATGRDTQAYNLLSTPPSSVQIAIPSICCMEALSALEDELKRRNRFENDLNLQISQLRRDAGLAEFLVKEDNSDCLLFPD
jgi:hypothetical protein